MAKAEVGIIGGSGLGDVLLREAGAVPVDMQTPFGPPSAPPLLAKWEGVDVAFLARHGEGHTLSPTQVPYRANIWAMKQLGVTRVIASGATGSLREEIEPGHLVICDQVIDKTSRRVSTFFDEGLAVHAEMADPFCPHLREVLCKAGERVDTTIHQSGTYICMEGPQFSTRAESNMHRQWGGDLIGMTCMPEAKLAREAELCYALVALPTDYDCWRPRKKGQAQEDLLAEILGNLKRATDGAVMLIREALRRMGDDSGGCKCRDALKLAIWSNKSDLAPNLRERLELLIGHRLVD